MLSRNFSRAEFACQCADPNCTFDTVDAELLQILQAEADHFSIKYGKVKRPRVEITSGNRCPPHNKAEGGAVNSEHLTGKAADHHVLRWRKWPGLKGKWVRVPAKEQYRYLCRTYPGKYGIGRYSNRCHVDSRGEEARWVSL